MPPHDFGLGDFLDDVVHTDTLTLPRSTRQGPLDVRVALADVKSELQKRHTCTDLGELRHYLGLQITRDRAACTITLSQSHMVQQVLQRFGLQHSTVQRTPLGVDHRLTGPFPDEPFEPSGPYAELVGCLMYLMTCTRPDLAFPLSILARFVAPGRHRPVHWTAAVRVAKYLATTSGVGLVLGGQQSVVLTGHCDSSYADDAETHRSTQGYCFSLGSGAVSWRSTRSSSISTSTAEAEIYAGAMAAQELRWLTFLLADLGERPSSAPTLFTNNKASILLCREPRLESRVKHIHVRYFLLRELQRRGQARFEFVESEANTAYIFTKALPPCDHQRCCVQLGLVDTGSSHTFVFFWTGNLKKPPPYVVVRWISRAWKAVPADLIRRAFLTCGISNAPDGSEDGLAMAHRRSQLTAEVDVDDSIIADGFFGNNCQEPEFDEE
ncbi:unnamed protein product [Closterium sp. NIES-53]